QGFLASGFDVKPRDFRGGTYKFRSTASGELPKIEDIEHTVTFGVPGTTMPAWGQFLTPEQIADVSRYLVVFSPRFIDAWRSQKAPTALVVPAAPADLHPLVARGAKLWKDFQCATCHGDKGIGDGPAAATLHDEWEHPTRATDLTYRWSFRNGEQPTD